MYYREGTFPGEKQTVASIILKYVGTNLVPVVSKFMSPPLVAIPLINPYVLFHYLYLQYLCDILIMITFNAYRPFFM